MQRKTYQTYRVSEAILKIINNGGDLYGYPVVMESGLAAGVVYPVLRRMVYAGWLTDTWEKTQPEDRPARRYYRTTPEGLTKIHKLVTWGRENFK